MFNCNKFLQHGIELNLPMKHRFNRLIHCGEINFMLSKWGFWRWYGKNTKNVSGWDYNFSCFIPPQKGKICRAIRLTHHRLHQFQVILMMSYLLWETAVIIMHLWYCHWIKRKHFHSASIKNTWYIICVLKNRRSVVEKSSSIWIF